MRTLYYYFTFNSEDKISDKEKIRIAIKKVRLRLADASVDTSVVGCFTSRGVTVLVEPLSQPDQLYREFKRAKERLNRSHLKIGNTVVGPCLEWKVLSY